MDLFGSLAGEVDRPYGGEGNGLVQQANAILLAYAEHIEEPDISCKRDFKVVELLAVLVDVGRNPAPVAIPDVIVVDVTVEAGEAEPLRLLLD